MKIYSINSTSHPYKQQNSTKNNTFAVYHTNSIYNQPFKSRLSRAADEIIEVVSEKGGKVVKKIDEWAKKTYDKLLDGFDTPRVKPVTETVTKSPAQAAVAKNSLIPEPVFTIDYKKVLSVLEKNEKVDAKWLKENENVLKAATNYRHAVNQDENFFIIQARQINNNREEWIQAVKEYEAKEQAAYIKSIEKEYIDIDPDQNKAKSLLGLKALQKYGSREDLKILNKNYYNISKDNDIMREYAKFVGKVGEYEDVIILQATLDKEIVGMYAEKTLEEIMKTIRFVMEDKAPVTSYKNYGYRGYKDIERCMKTFDNNQIIRENAQAIMRRIEADNPEYNPAYKS